jgi:hypothetical protein
MNKFAYYLGQAHVLHSLGLSEDHVKLAFMRQGLSYEDADGICKEAGWASAVAKGLAWAGKGISGLLGRGGTKGIQALKFRPVAAGAKGGLLNPKNYATTQNITKAVRPNVAQRVGESLTGAAKGLETAPGQTLLGGAKNFGRGMMFSSKARGIGGVAGKGLTGYLVGRKMLQ